MLKAACWSRSSLEEIAVGRHASVLDPSPYVAHGVIVRSMYGRKQGARAATPLHLLGVFLLFSQLRWMSCARFDLQYTGVVWVATLHV